MRHSKLIDEYHSNPNYPYHGPFKKEKIKFNSKDVEDHDFLVKMAHTLMIVTALEVKQGVENLWKGGRPNFRRYYLNFS